MISSCRISYFICFFVMQCKAADQPYRSVCLLGGDRDMLTFAISIISVFVSTVCVWGGGDNLKVRAAAIFVTVD